MDIGDQLLVELSRRNTDFIAHYIGNDTDKFHQLIDLLFNGKSPIPQRAAWVVTHIAEKYPELCLPFIEPIILNLEKFEHTGIHRCLLRFIAEMNIPESLQGILYGICYKWLINKESPIAVKVHCMQILYNISEVEPDLKHELRLIIGELTDHDSAGLRSRSRHLMERL